ncbi:MAG TPA: AMP-binding protein, partial [Ktedonobacteraceae bacterium]|nr:AMP-binding protein [Ktedonobacteraceae bacterium]
MYTPRHSFEAARDSATLVALLQWRAQKEPQQRAYIFLKDGENIEETMTYGELDQRARAIGALLQANQIASGTCVLLLYPPGLEYVAAFFGCLYSGVIAVPAYPPLRNQRSIQRLQAIIHDSQASAVLTTSRLLEQERLLFVTDWQLPGIKWLETDGDGMVEQLAGAWQEPPLSAGSLALLQYTSGSTSTPKGVMISHENLLHNLAVIEHCCGHTTESHGVTWAPPYHDLGLVGGVLQPVYGGFPVTFMSPFAFLQRPIRWLQALSRTKGTTSGGPNFAYELCIRKISPDECAALSIDLSHWSLAFCSAEPVYPSTFERFAQVFEPFGFRREAFYPCYGLAESTLLVTGGRKLTVPIIRHFNSAALTRNEVELEDGGGDTRSSTLISSGQALPGYDLIIVDPATSLPCPPQRIGEIWIAGPCVAQGYWRRPEETEQFLQARPAGIPAEKTFLRSGDLGFLCEEELFVTGRLKDLIIIRGRNYYPQDIEQIASQSHPALRSGAGAAFSIDVSGEERLVLVHEIDRHYARQDKAPIIDAIRRAIAEELNIQTYAIVLIKAASLPKTTSGKVQRYACRKAFLERGLDIWEQSVFAPSEDEPQGNESQHVWLTPQVLLAAPGNQNALLESFLRQEIARLLNCDSAKINTSQPLSVFGLDSLVAIELGNSIEAHCGVALPLSYLLQGATIDEIVAAIHAKLQSDPSPKTMPQVQAIAPGEDAYPLSYGQQALWLLDSLSPHSPLYTIARAVKSKRKLDASALKRALQVLLERHDSLRAVFSVKDEQPVYKICREQEAFLVVENASDWDDDAVDTYLAEKSRLPFDLTKGPLLKTYLLERSGRDSILFFVVHHLVVDLWSLSILVRELGELYAREMRAIAVPLPQPEFHYHDFVRWQTGMLAENKGRQLKAYWENQLAGNLPFLNIHADYPRPALSTYKGSSISFSIDESISAKLQAFLQKKSITLYTALLAAFQILLYRYTGQEDIIIGSPVANRELQAFHDIVGYFANIIPIRSKVSGKLSCSTFLGQTRGEVLAALENQGYPFPLLVQHLQPERSSGTTPIIQVMFALQSIGGPDSKAMAALALNKPGEMFVINDLVLESLPLKNITSEFELALTLAETRSGIFASIEYSTELFEEATVQRLAQQYQRVIEQMVSDPNQRLDHLDVLPEEERQELLAGWNATARPYPEQRAVHQLFEDQARRCPQAIALTSQEESLSYHELNRRANCLAHYLQTLGVGPDILVGICLERSPEMVIAMLAILKAGGAYMPLDPTYPAHRLAFMLQDSKAAVLLTREQLCPHLPIAQAKLVCLDTQWERIAEYSETNIQSEANLGNLAYVIYTSGSTGQPKGVLVEHRGVVNHCLFFKERCDLQMDDRVLQFASLSFDTSVEEIFPSLISGATLVLRPPDVT